MIDPRVASLCAEFSITIVDRHVYPEIGQTRAVETMARILRRFGEAHLRLVLLTLAETANNKANMDEVSFWCVSDMIRAWPDVIEHRTSEWLECFDEIPFGELQFCCQDLSGIISQRYALGGMVFERLYRRFGPRANQPDLFDDRRKETA